MGNKVVDIIEGITGPVQKLIEIISKGIGTLYRPHQIKKIADAEAYKIKVISQAISEKIEVPIKYQKDGLTIDSIEYEELQKRAVCRFVQQETSRQYNIENVADAAYDILKEETFTESDKTIDEDWVTRFISCVQDISDEDMQKLWAKILADEIKKPNSYSMRALDTLKNLSKKEAELFARLCYMVVDDNFIPNELDLLKKYDITYNDILMMDDCNLVNSNPLLTVCKALDPSKNVLCVSTNYLLKSNVSNDVNLSLPGYPLTPTGVELFHIAYEAKEDDFFVEYSKMLKKKYPHIDLSLHKINSIDGSSINFDDEDLFNLMTE